MSLTKINLPGGLIQNAAANIVGAGELFTTGKVFYVDSNNGGDGNLGEDPAFPKATIDSAVTAARANRGDIIVLMPNHAQNLTNATAFQLDKAGLTVIGLGEGRNRPTFSFTGTSGAVNVDSADCRISNVVFVADISAVVQGIDLDANDFTLDNCEFNFNETGDDFINAVNAGASDRFTFVNNKVIAENAVAGIAPALTGIVLVGNSDLVISGNEFSGAFSSACIYDSNAGGQEGDHYEIVGNTFYNSTATLGLAVDLNSTARGILAYNVAGILAALVAYDPASLTCLENYATTAIDRSGVIQPGIL